MSKLCQSLPNIFSSWRREETPPDDFQPVHRKFGTSMIPHEASNKPFSVPPSKESLNLIVSLNDPLIASSKGPLSCTSYVSSNNLLNKPSGNKKKPRNHPTNSPRNNPTNDSRKHSLNKSLSLSLYTQVEEDESLIEMALPETPILHPPSNSPTQTMEEPLNDRSHLAPHAEAEHDEFEDADEFKESAREPIVSMHLHDALADCERAITLFFNNHLDEAIAIMSPWKSTSLYHAHGAAIFEFIPALLTLDPTQIQRAQVALQQTFALCTRTRRIYSLIQSLSAFLKQPNYAGYTEVEAHAELVHAEALLLSACLSVVENEDITGIFRASVGIKASYSDYTNCAKILDKKNWEDEESRAHFESGVRLGLSTFNVMIAMLPPRLVTILEFVGFTADKEKGLAELLNGSQSTGLRSVLCDLTLLVYYLVIGHFAAIPPDFGAAEKIITKALNKYPNSVWFLMFKARMQLLRGQILDAIETYQRTCRMKNLWPQMKHLAYWELHWAFTILKQWTNAAEYAALLERDSKWSRTIYMYAQASALLQNEPNSVSERNRINELLSYAPNHRQRILGRSLPMEKFVLRRCERWQKRGYLVLPGIEWLYLWNIFPSLAAERANADQILKIIERTSVEIKFVLNKKKKQKGKKSIQKVHDIIDYDEDEMALVEFLQGSLLAAMSLPRLALQNLENVLMLKGSIREYTYLVPYAVVEMSSCHYQLGDTTRATSLLHDARKKYSGYLLESRLNFRIHAKLEYLRAGIPYSRITVTPAKPTITGADVIAARKSVPPVPIKTDNELDTSAKSKLGLCFGKGANPKTKADLNLTKGMTTVYSSKINARQELNLNLTSKSGPKSIDPLLLDTITDETPNPTSNIGTLVDLSCSKQTEQDLTSNMYKLNPYIPEVSPYLRNDAELYSEKDLPAGPSYEKNLLLEINSNTNVPPSAYSEIYTQPGQVSKVNSEQDLHPNMYMPGPSSRADLVPGTPLKEHASSDPRSRKNEGLDSDSRMPKLDPNLDWTMEPMPSTSFARDALSSPNSEENSKIITTAVLESGSREPKPNSNISAKPERNMVRRDMTNTDIEMDAITTEPQPATSDTNISLTSEYTRNKGRT